MSSEASEAKTGDNSRTEKGEEPIFYHPFQKLCSIGQISEDVFIILAASASHIFSLNLCSGSILGIWPPDGSRHDYSNGLANSDSHERPEDDVSPNKRQKLGAGNDGSDSSDSVEIVSARAKGQRRKAKVLTSKLPKVSHLIATTDKKHVVAVTAEDKCVRTFEINQSGSLKPLSERYMPKRVCAIVLTPDQSMLLVGDKFGDVYSLPLLVSTEVRASTAPPATEMPTPKFQTSASELTVHTKGNREALRQQREQKASPKKKEGPTFEHKLLLGHVSLLTDLVITEVKVEGKKRQYILTADRDEHIRVSRGPSQAYIIENYCLGHKEFVSKLCVFPWDTNFLVAGSGETSLKVFHWRTGRLVDEISFHDHFFHLGPEFPMAVSGLWSMAIPSQFGIDSTPTYPGLVVVALEARPELLCYRVTHEGSLRMWQIINARMNVLDLAVLEDPDPGRWTMLVSLDRVHVPGSGKQFRTSSSSWELDIESFNWQPGRPPGPRWGLSDDSKREDERENWSGWWASDRDLCDDSTLSHIKPKTNETVRDCVTKQLPETMKKMKCRQLVDIAQKPPERASYSDLGEFLYGLENLRKNKRDEAGEAGDEPSGGEVAAGGAE